MTSLQFPPVPVKDAQGVDWSYSMRRDMQEILPGIYLGPYAAAMKSKNFTDGSEKAKQRVLQRFKDEYMNGIIQRSILGQHHTHCRLCGNDFSIGHGGKFDVEKHMKTRKHIELARLTNSNTKLLALQQNGISHIVCIRQAIEAHFVRPNFPDMFEYLVLDVADTVTENIIRYFPKVRDFVDKALKSGGKVLIHGNAGISRSGALMIAYVMEKHGLSYKEAYSYVQQRRFCVNPNEGFAQQLMEYEPMYKARMCQGLVEFCGNADVLKRKCPYESEEENRDTGIS